MRELLLAVDQFHVLRWLNANVASTGTLAQALRSLSARIFSVFNDVFGYHNARLPAGPARRSFTVRRGHLETIFLTPNARMRS